MRKGIFFALMVIFLFLASACDVYNTLFIKKPEIQGEVVAVPEGNITIEISDELDRAEPVETEAKNEAEASNDATVIIVEETELVSLVPKAEDPDADALDFTFTSPLDENGEWKTNYGDNGEYTITVTASDGTLTTSKEILVIVKKKEEAPVFDTFNPESNSVAAKETDSIEFDVKASDMNKDELGYVWKLDGVEVANEPSYEYQTTYEDSGSHTVKIIVSDGTFETEKIWAVSVDNLNRKPEMADIEPMEAKETDKVVVSLDATDGDNDQLSYSIDDKRFEQDGNVFTWDTDYDSSGDYTFEASASDGTDTTTKEVKVKVENVNRAPLILDIVQKK